MIDPVLNRIIAELQSCPFVRGIVLGGSRATGTATADSDIDIGIYYMHGAVDFARLNAAAARLDDAHREGLICREGEWGNWVNCGGWLTIDGHPVDLILRDFDRVTEVLAQTERGEFSANYQTGHPHAYLSAMYRGELACCRVLYAQDADFLAQKRRAEHYPEPLREALLAFFLFEAGFSCLLAGKQTGSEDLYYVSGHLFRAISALNQVLFALNRVYCLNEKKAPRRIDSFPIAPANYQARINKILALTAGGSSVSVAELEQLCSEVRQLAAADQTGSL